MKTKTNNHPFALAKTATFAAVLCLSGLSCMGEENNDGDALALSAAAAGASAGYDSASQLSEPRLIESLMGRFVAPGDDRNDSGPITRPIVKLPAPKPKPIIIIQPWLRDSDKDGMTDWQENYLMRKYAPYLKMHPKETSFPADVHWALSKVNLRHNSDNFCSDRVVYNYGQVSPRRLSKTTVPGKGSSGLRFCGNTSNRYHTWIKYSSGKSFYMNVPTQIYPGNMGNAKCYAHVRPGNVDGSKYLIDYWFYYTYNAAYKGIAGGHQGDWEHIQVRVGSKDEIRSIRYFAHGSESKERKGTDPRLRLTSAGRPIVYSARYTHASYPAPLKWRRSGAAIFTPDYTADGGRVLDCSGAGRTVNVGRTKYPAWNQEWIRYKGYWGFKQTFGRAGGPSGPNMD